MAFVPHSQNPAQTSQVREAKTSQRHGDFEHWKTLGENVDDLATAKVIVSFLDRAPDLKAFHAGLYLRASARVLKMEQELAQQMAKELAEQAAIRQEKLDQAILLAKQILNLAYRSVRLTVRGCVQLYQRATVQRKLAS